MHIAIVTGPFLPLPPAPGGAVERLWQELAEEFVALGHTVTFYCRAHETQLPNESIRGIRYVRRLKMTRSSYLYLDIAKDFFYSLYFAFTLRKADVVVTNAFWLPAMLPILRPGSGKIVVNVARMPKGQLGLYRNVDRFAAVSRAVLAEIQRQNARVANKTRVISNPIDTSVFKPPIAARSRVGIPTILYVGRIHPEKGVHVLINAFRHLVATGVQSKLRIVGPIEVELGGGGQIYAERLLGLAENLPIEWTGPIFDKARLAEIYRGASVFCYPSLADQGESFGLAPLEAMATGLVPVVSNLACFKDFIEDGATGMTFDHRAVEADQELANCLYRLLNSTDMLHTMSIAAATRARDFSRERIAREYVDDFQLLLGQACQ